MSEARLARPAQCVHSMKMPKASTDARAADDLDRALGNAIRLRRRSLNLTQEQLASACGISFQQVQKYERGANRIGASRLHDLSRVLDVPVSFFFEGVPLPTDKIGGFAEDASPEYVQATLSTSDGLALVKAFSQVKNPKLRRRIVDLIEEMAGPAAT